MKNLLIGIFLFTLIGCYETTTYRTLDVNSNIILLKKNNYGFRAGSYRFYIFDGTQSEWYHVSDITYNKYNEGDTLNNVVLTTTIRTNETCIDESKE